MEQGQGQSVVKRRDAMPITASFIDKCRAAFGSDMVDRQMAIAQQARREYNQVLNEQGEAAAKRWHKANAYRCTFSASEGGRTLGLPLPNAPTPPIGTPGALSRAGNSTPDAAPVAGSWKSPVISPRVRG